jgi:hypothetical protein
LVPKYIPLKFQCKKNLFQHHLDCFCNTASFFSYTPLIRAAEKENQSLAKFILKAKNNDISSDRKREFMLTSKPCGGVYWTTRIIKVKKASVNDGNIVIS